ncbi:MAG: cache domain-containing protein [Rhodospirillaceae bacterium]
MRGFGVIAIVWVALLSVGVSPLWAGEFGTKEEAEALVEKAAGYWAANGREKAVAAFNDRQGPFVDRDLYIVAANLGDGVRIAHGFNAKMIGKSLNDFKDIEGKPYGLEILEMAKTKGSGWVDYKFTNPVSKRVMDKTSYLKKVDDVVIFAGAYK